MKKINFEKRGGALVALPLLLLLSLFTYPAIADSGTYGNPFDSVKEEAPHLDATGMLLFVRPESLNDIPQSLGFPATGGQVALYGGGASFGKGPLRVGVQGLTGGVSARQGGMNTEWRMHFGHVILEQRYPYGQFLITGGSIFTYGLVEGLLENNSAITRYDGTVYGGGFVVGGRWPRETLLGFMFRSGYEWLPVNGAWKGALVANSPKTSLDLGGAFTQIQVELSF